MTHRRDSIKSLGELGYHTSLALRSVLGGIIPPAASDGCGTTLHYHPRPRERSISDAQTWGVRDHERMSQAEYLRR
jgi:hypothetical protein